METSNPMGSAPEVDLSDKPFTTVQAQLALHGIELHRITGSLGREAYSVHVHGQIRTLDTLHQVTAYARCLGVVVLTA